MPISSADLQNMISELAKHYKFNEASALQHLAAKNMLPKNLTKQLTPDTAPAKKESIFASKKAEELARDNNIKPKGEGTGKNGKWNMKDILQEITKKQAVEEHLKSEEEESEEESED
jgi:hypothetical protein